MNLMKKKILLVLVFFSFGFLLTAQEDKEKVMLVNFQKSNIHINNSMKNLANEKGLTKKTIKERSTEAASSAFGSIARKNNFEVLRMNDQVALSSAEFSELTEKERIDKLSEEEEEKSFLEWLKGIFISGPEDDYMAASFSSDKLDRIKTTLKQKNADYVMILHKYELNRKLFGDGEFIVHYTVLNHKGEILLGEQRAYKAELEKSMKKNIFPYMIQSSFLEVFGIAFDKLS